jgi:hypothetical protein
MNSKVLKAAAIALCCAPLWAAAADFDGSKTLICATIEAQDCDVGEGCKQGLPDSVGAPRFMRIDFAKKVVVGPKRTTPIVSLHKSERQLLMQGTELGYAWTIALDSEDGSLNATLVNGDGVVVLFGDCIPQ